MSPNVESARSDEMRSDQPTRRTSGRASQPRKRLIEDPSYSAGHGRAEPTGRRKRAFELSSKKEKDEEEADKDEEGEEGIESEKDFSDMEVSVYQRLVDAVKAPGST